MRTTTACLLAALAIAGCTRPSARAPLETTGPPPTAPAPPTAAGPVRAYTGEVWVWDEQTSTVTLRLATNEIVRIKVSPDQLRGLRQNQTATVRGVPTGPAEIQHSVVQLAMMAPRGPADTADVTGTVAALDPAGRVTVSAPDGPVEVWVQPPASAYRVGDRVRVRMSVQALEITPIKPGDTVPVAQAAPGPEPGDYATIRSRITGTRPGRLVVESPRGPVVVVAPAGDRYAAGGAVELRTSVHPVR
jgi:hypothetical protein